MNPSARVVRLEVVVPHHRHIGAAMIIGDQLRSAAACSLSRHGHLIADVAAAGWLTGGLGRDIRQETVDVPRSLVSRSRPRPCRAQPRPYRRGPAHRASIISAATATGASASASAPTADDDDGGDRSEPATAAADDDDDDDDVNNFKSRRGRSSSLTPSAGAAAADVVIVGGGIAGLATALALHKVGISAKVLEKAPDLRGEGASIGIWSNAWRALEVLGVADELRSRSFQIDKVMTWSLSQSQSTRRLISSMDLRGSSGDNLTSSSSSSLELRGVMRNRLLEALSSSLPPDTIRFNAGVSSIREVIPSGAPDGWDLDSSTNSDHADLLQTPTLEVRSEDGVTWRPKVLIGCDGIGSKVGSWLNLPKPVYSGQMAYRGVAEFPSGIPTWAGRILSADDPCCCFQQTVGVGMRVGMYPINDELVYWFVAYNNRAQDDVPPKDPAARKKALLELVSDGWEESGIVDTVKNTEVGFITHSVLSGRYYPPFLPAVRWGRGCVTLAGDSAHPMTPNLGQGGCMALEDAVVLARQMAASGAFSSTTRLKNTTTGTPATGRSSNQSRTEDLIASAIERYERERIARTTLITYRSWAVGQVMLSTLAPLRFFRDEILLPYMVSPKTLKSSTAYDCGTLI